MWRGLLISSDPFFVFSIGSWEDLAKDFFDCPPLAGGTIRRLYHEAFYVIESHSSGFVAFF